MRGNPYRECQPVPRRFPAFLSTKDAKPFSQGSGRLELAQKIVDPENPLTARVFVNRVWMHHFGQGLVRTPSDFGLRSQPPSHPELLDWLATAFIDNGWSVKHLHRMIMNSAVYQQRGNALQQAEIVERAKRVDPENRLLGHFPRQRLDFESMRDSLLAVSGSLDRTKGGPPVDVVSGFTPRRTVYGFINRMDLPGLMRAFDFPEPAATSPRRDRTTVAPQSLFFMNNDFTTQCAQRLLRRQEIASTTDMEPRIERIYRLLFSRKPDKDELALARDYIHAKPALTGAPLVWSYGYGAIDESKKRVVGFTELRHWTGQRWQAGPTLPDPKLGWVFVDGNGGHPAATLDRCAIRRWTSPVAGKIEIG
ncbi:MAG: DUF1553 domain-containing protein, partial [Planctomycetes bacterium]|nr:DUF1553 domain-containing protein [Planctomycetota bacterium]